MLLENNELSDDSDDKKKNDRKPKPGSRAARKAARSQAAAAKAEEGDAEELEKLKRIMPWFKDWKLGDRWAPKDVCNLVLGGAQILCGAQQRAVPH